MENGSETWLRRFVPRRDAARRIVCMPHGGGGATGFRPWSEALPDTEVVTVQYPGREDRVNAGFPPDVDTLAGQVADELAPLLDRPYSLFGHSMGATVAHEVAHALRDRGLPEPERLFASGREAPHDEQGGTVHLLDDEGLAAELRRLGGTDAEVMRAPELRAMILAYVREDYRLIETYRPRERAPLTCPISVFLGASDPDLDPARATRWAGATQGPTDLRVFPGDHFYLVEHRAETIAAVAAALGPAPAGARSTAG